MAPELLGSPGLQDYFSTKPHTTYVMPQSTQTLRITDTFLKRREGKRWATKGTVSPDRSTTKL